jgi:signal transduction histidine kinase
VTSFTGRNGSADAPRQGGDATVVSERCGDAAAATAGLNRRVLVIDDNEAVQADYRKILLPAPIVSGDLAAAEAALFGAAGPGGAVPVFELATASQGHEGHDLVLAAAAAGRPFAMAFVDMRMPPGWDGIETIERIWNVCPDIEMVICTAYADRSWDELARRLGATDRLLIVKKPFDHAEVRQAACALTHKWNLHRQSQQTLAGLAAIVEERTRELRITRDQLVELNREILLAKDAAEAANRAKTLFLANVSHELRTPMTSILGYAEALEDRLHGRDIDPFESGAIRTIRRNSEHLIGLIGDLLDVSRLEAGQLRLDRVPCSPAELLAQVDSILRPKADEKGLEFTVDCPAAMPGLVETDPLRLRQILVNLADNAIKFTDRGSVRVTARAIDGEAPRLVVAVRDTGLGMSPDEQARIFSPFVQADASITRRFGGSGLGLAISRHLATLLGGGIEIASAPGAGSCFTLTIAAPPVVRAAPPPVVAAGGPAARVSAEALLAGARVLLVEDGRDNQRLVGHILGRAGCAVAIAENGAECLGMMAADAAFDLVLMDMQMPVMGGLEATTRLRERGCRVPIVMLTANALAEIEVECRRAGADAYLTKPVGRQRLLEALAEQLRRTRG